MDPVSISAIIVSLVAAGSAILSQRAAARASIVNASTASKTETEKSRTEMEKEAYDRARAFDTETIRRQDQEIAEIRYANRHLNADVKMVHDENEKLYRENLQLREEVKRLKFRVSRLEGMPVEEEPHDDIPTNPEPRKPVSQDLPEFPRDPIMKGEEPVHGG